MITSGTSTSSAPALGQGTTGKERDNRNMARGEKHGRAKLTEWDVMAIRILLAEEDPVPMADIARAFSVIPRTIHGIRDGRIWGWL